MSIHSKLRTRTSHDVHPTINLLVIDGHNRVRFLIFVSLRFSFPSESALRPVRRKKGKKGYSQAVPCAAREGHVSDISVTAQESPGSRLCKSRAAGVDMGVVGLSVRAHHLHHHRPACFRFWVKWMLLRRWPKPQPYARLASL
jgi:hypothetical protein